MPLSTVQTTWGIWCFCYRRWFGLATGSNWYSIFEDWIRFHFCLTHLEWSTQMIAQTSNCTGIHPKNDPVGNFHLNFHQWKMYPQQNQTLWDCDQLECFSFAVRKLKILYMGWVSCPTCVHFRWDISLLRAVFCWSTALISLIILLKEGQRLVSL